LRVRPQHPFKILRKFLKGHPDLRQASTQAGFAELVGCSRSLIRAVEQGQAKITTKLAKQVQTVTGVSISWLSTPQAPDEPIPAAAGGELKHEAVIAMVAKEIERNLRDAERNLLLDPEAKEGVHAQDAGSQQTTWRRIAAAMGRLVEEAIFEGFTRGEDRLAGEITKTLAKTRPGASHDSGQS
jgi:transcriptional regulator with XRE-family HTH domain